MIKLQNVCYVRLGTRDLEGATRFATDILGLEVSEWGKGARHFKSDGREHTLCYVDGDPSVQVAGFEVAHKEYLDQAATELEKLGHAVHVGTRQEADARMVRNFIGFSDPTGNRIPLEDGMGLQALEAGAHAPRIMTARLGVAFGECAARAGCTSRLCTAGIEGSGIDACGGTRGALARIASQWRPKCHVGRFRGG